jgi:hypothetical protein
LTKKLRERDLGRDLESAKITLDEYLDRWLEIINPVKDIFFIAFRVDNGELWRVEESSYSNRLLR